MTGIPSNLEADVVQQWHDLGYTKKIIELYLSWTRRFYLHHECRGTDPVASLTKTLVAEFARHYAAEHTMTEASVVRKSGSSLHRWSRSLQELGVRPPAWNTHLRLYPEEFRGLVEAFEDWSIRVRGNQPCSVRIQCHFVARFLSSAGDRGASPTAPTLADVDAFIVQNARKYAPRTVMAAGRAVRAYLRFLHTAGHLSVDLASGVGPIRAKVGDSPRALPWPEVRRLLRAPDRRTARGKRDYAILILMATCGLGAAEARTLRLEDIDWHERVIAVTRPKTGVRTLLPMVDGVGQAVEAYLRVRPRAPVRNVFVISRAPYGPLHQVTCSALVRRYAAAAGIKGRFGSHRLRHSHATRQVEADVPLKVVSDIMGHTDAKSTSTYVRVAIPKLRDLCLPVPL